MYLQNLRLDFKPTTKGRHIQHGRKMVCLLYSLYLMPEASTPAGKISGRLLVAVASVILPYHKPLQSFVLASTKETLCIWSNRSKFHATAVFHQIVFQPLPTGNGTLPPSRYITGTLEELAWYHEQLSILTILETFLVFTWEPLAKVAQQPRRPWSGVPFEQVHKCKVGPKASIGSDTLDHSGVLESCIWSLWLVSFWSALHKTKTCSKHFETDDLPETVDHTEAWCSVLIHFEPQGLQVWVLVLQRSWNLCGKKHTKHVSLRHRHCSGFCRWQKLAVPLHPCASHTSPTSGFVQVMTSNLTHPDTQWTELLVEREIAPYQPLSISINIQLHKIA